MPYYKILDVSHDRIWEELAADGSWYPHDGTIRADTHFTRQEAMRVMFPAGWGRLLHVLYCED